MLQRLVWPDRLFHDCVTARTLFHHVSSSVWTLNTPSAWPTGWQGLCRYRSSGCWRSRPDRGATERQRAGQDGSACSLRHWPVVHELSGVREGGVRKARRVNRDRMGNDKRPSGDWSIAHERPTSQDSCGRMGSQSREAHRKLEGGVESLPQGGKCRVPSA